MPWDKEKKKQYSKKYWEKNKAVHNQRKREKYHLNKEVELAKFRAYQQQPKYLKYRRIKDWRYQGIIFHDMDLLHDIYEQTTHCDNCNVFLQGKGNEKNVLTMIIQSQMMKM